MIGRIVLPVILASLTWGFWISPTFKEIAAGVAIFLFGMLALEQGFQAFTGGLLEKLLARTTDRTWKSISFGIVSTSIMQSSSLVSIITISFLSAGLISLQAGLGIIFGANIGTTTGAWLVAALGVKIKISAYALPMLVFGIVLIFQKLKWLKGIGYVLAGLGFLFLGIHYMKEGFAAFKDTIALSQYHVPGLRGLIIYTLIGIIATVIMQSSHATLVLIITGLAAKQFNYENAIALAIGANIGTTVTAIIGSLGSNIAGKRLAAGHLIFNVITGLVALIFIYQLIWLVDLISRTIGIPGQDYAQQLAVFHTLFNVLGVAMLLPFMGVLEKQLVRRLPDRNQKRLTISVPHFLNEAALPYPEAALKVIHQECLHLLENCLGIMARVAHLRLRDIQSDQDLEELLHYVPPQKRDLHYKDLQELYRMRVKGLYNAIIEFSLRAQENMPPSHIHLIHALKSACKDMVNALKSSMQIAGNIQLYMQHENRHIRLEYQQIRLRIAHWLRLFYELEKLDSSTDLILYIDKMQYIRRQSDVLKNNTLDSLIRDHLINIEMATSLLNDTTWMHSIGKDLIKVASWLYIHTSAEFQNLPEDFMDPAQDHSHDLPAA
ncbi:MAG: Na/Pi cotransporter family protein [Leptospiraceae bacterium]|nr:Na/Pi cotransporter family protein [Leptospiraceae bacterium]